MKVSTILTAVTAVLAFEKAICCSDCCSTLYQFPDGFAFGAASGAYQSEGAWNVSDKGESIWDWFTHNMPNDIADRSNGDVASDSYHKYKEDIQILKYMGMDHYRLSISWTRILPTGFANNISASGIQYYKDLLDELNANGITPLVTLYHWDHPQVLEDMGGWLNDKMIEYFADYATVVFRELGSKVKLFATINEPNELCSGGYSDGSIAPGKKIYGVGNYICGHNILKAHARAYHIYDKKFRPTQKGKIGIVLVCMNSFPKNPNDTTSSDIAFQFICGWMAHPIYKGDYPQVMKQMIGDNSKSEGRSQSRLPKFSDKWISYIKGTQDYMGLNYYTSFLVEPAPKTNNVTLWLNDTGLIFSADPSWLTTAFPPFRVVPEGLRALLNTFKSEYNNPPIIITECGMADDGDMVDNDRISFFYLHLEQVLNAMYEDGCNVNGFFAWSLTDDFEWENGYNLKFGLVRVDFNDPNRSRSLKLSTRWWKEVILQRRLVLLD